MTVSLEWVAIVAIAIHNERCRGVVSEDADVAVRLNAGVGEDTMVAGFAAMGVFFVAVVVLLVVNSKKKSV